MMDDGRTDTFVRSLSERGQLAFLQDAASVCIGPSFLVAAMAHGQESSEAKRSESAAVKNLSVAVIIVTRLQ